MKNKLTLHRLFAFAVLCFVSAVHAHAQAPQAVKVEPPSWWSGSSLNPVRVMIRGQNLTNAKIEARDNLTISNVKINERGTYLFADLSITPNARAGKRELKITNAAGATNAAFEVLPPLNRANKFQGFNNDDVIYLIMPDRFADGDASNNNPAKSPGLYDRRRKRFYHGGDFAGIRKRLPYLKELGITALWLNPWYDNSDRLNERESYEVGAITDYHGYGATDFYGVEEHFGTFEELRALVNEAHRNGIKIIQDQVANHSGPYHVWVKDSPTPTWYNGTEANHTANPFLPWTLQDSYGANTEAARTTLDGWFINILPDMNQDDAEACAYIIQNTLWWIGTTGLDAIRQDTLPYVPRSFWSDWMSAIKKEFPNVNVVGELYDGDPALVSFFQGGVRRFDGVDSKVDSLFDFPLFYPIRTAFAEGKTIRAIPQMLARDHLYPRPNDLVTFIGNHDMLRFMNEPNATYTGLKLAQTLLLTTRGVPQIYYGDEIAIQGAGDPDNRRDFPGGFPGDARDAFTERGRTTDEQSAFEHVKKLTSLRRELAPLRRGRLTHLVVNEQQYVYARTLGNQTVVVVFNNDSKPATVEFDARLASLTNNARLIDRLQMNTFGVKPAEVVVSNNSFKVEMPGRTAAIYVVR